MAIDSALVEFASESAFAGTIRVYSWAEPVVTVGRLQNAEEVRSHFPNRILVRRPTGGQAVEHGDDLTVSIVVKDGVVAQKADRRVLAAHRLLVKGMQEAVQLAGVCVESGSELGRNRQVDCFSTARQCDLIESTGGRKFLGSAQLRTQGIVLEQMSLRPITGRDWLSNSFGLLLQECFTRTLGIDDWSVMPGPTEEERNRAREIETSLIC